MRRLAIGDHGTDVRHLQEAINFRSGDRHMPLIATDGQFGAETRKAAERVARALGVREDTLARRPLTVGVQRIIKYPDTRTPLQLMRARERKLAHPSPVLMYDSIYPRLMPKDASAVAGYVGGKWPTYDDLAALFPRAKRVSIAVASIYDADILDVEKGDAPPEKAAPWMLRQLARKASFPGIYCSVSIAQDIVDRLASAGIHRDEYRLWTAHYTGSPHVCDSKCGFGLKLTADATQYTSNALGRTLDASVCKPTFWR